MMPDRPSDPGTAGARREAIVFLTHRYSPVVMRVFRTLQAEAGAFGDVYLLGDCRTAPASLDEPAFRTFDFDALKQDYPSRLGEHLVPGNSHLVYLDFLQRHSWYDALWFIEYDVRYSGSWAGFFAAQQSLTADLVGCHLRPWRAEPKWSWWPTLAMPAGAVPEENRWRGFFPIMRISAKALRILKEKMEAGWRGHFEALIPTVLVREGLEVADLEGNSPGEGRRCCTCIDSKDGCLTGFGTMRFRPAHLFWGLRRDLLYHPVKDDAAIGDLLLRNGWLKAKLAARRLGRIARGKPV